MKTNVVLFLIVVAGLAALVHSREPVEDLPFDFYCGPRLSEALAYACPDGLLAKRSGGEALARQEMPWLPAHKVVRVLGRTKRGVVNECCFKPCGMSELTAYCAPQ